VKAFGLLDGKQQKLEANKDKLLAYIRDNAYGSDYSMKTVYG
jgi:hypothetical protein